MPRLHLGIGQQFKEEIKLAKSSQREVAGEIGTSLGLLSRVLCGANVSQGSAEYVLEELLGLAELVHVRVGPIKEGITLGRSLFCCKCRSRGRILFSDKCLYCADGGPFIVGERNDGPC